MNPGDLVQGRYEVVRRVANGGNGVVYQARDRATGDDVALKVLGAPAARGGLERFRREADVLARLRHPNITRFEGFGWDERDHPFLVQEWVPGITLRARLVAGMTVRAIVDMARQIASALAEAHRHGVVHRDVSPANLLDAGVRWRLADFGVALVIGDAQRLTRSDAMVGTLGYMAPEQARPEPDVDARADVFGLGCVLYEALTGRRAFGGRDALTVRAKLLFVDPIPIGRLCPGVPRPLLDLIDRMIRKPRGERPADGAAVERELDALDLARLPDERAAVLGDDDVVTRDLAQPIREPYVAVALSAPGSHDVATPLAGFAGSVEHLDDGTILYRASGDGTAARARDAARAGLALADTLPGTPVAVAGGRGSDGLARAVDLATAAIRAGTFGRIFAALAGDAGGVRIDPDTAALLDDELEVEVEPIDGAQLVVRRRRSDDRRAG